MIPPLLWALVTFVLTIVGVRTFEDCFESVQTKLARALGFLGQTPEKAPHHG